MLYWASRKNVAFLIHSLNSLGRSFFPERSISISSCFLRVLSKLILVHFYIRYVKCHRWVITCVFAMNNYLGSNWKEDLRRWSSTCQKCITSKVVRLKFSCSSSLKIRYENNSNKNPLNFSTLLAQCQSNWNTPKRIYNLTNQFFQVGVYTKEKDIN